MKFIFVGCLCGLFLLLGCKAEPPKVEEKRVIPGLVPDGQVDPVKKAKILSIANKYRDSEFKKDTQDTEISVGLLNQPRKIECYRICEENAPNCVEEMGYISIEKPYWVTQYRSCRSPHCKGGRFWIYIDDETEKIICVFGIK